MSSRRAELVEVIRPGSHVQPGTRVVEHRPIVKRVESGQQRSPAWRAAWRGRERRGEKLIPSAASRFMFGVAAPRWRNGAQSAQLSSAARKTTVSGHSGSVPDDGLVFPSSGVVRRTRGISRLSMRPALVSSSFWSIRCNQQNALQDHLKALFSGFRRLPWGTIPPAKRGFLPACRWTEAFSDPGRRTTWRPLSVAAVVLILPRCFGPSKPGGAAYSSPDHPEAHVPARRDGC